MNAEALPIMLVSISAGLVGCGFSGIRVPDPAVVPGSYGVRYSVTCNECTVNYTTGAGFASDNVSGMWSRVVQLDGSVTQAVTLTASPARAGVVVERARIDIDGRCAAQARSRTADAFAAEVTLTAMLGRTEASGPGCG